MNISLSKQFIDVPTGKMLFHKDGAFSTDAGMPLTLGAFLLTLLSIPDNSSVLQPDERTRAFGIAQRVIKDESAIEFELSDREREILLKYIKKYVTSIYIQGQVMDALGYTLDKETK